MRALRIHGPGDLRVEELDIPQPGPGEIVLRITGAGVCGTDATLARLGTAVIPQGQAFSWPVVLGHEFAGVAVAAGAGVPDESVGIAYACGAGVSCGDCARCRDGRTNLCEAYWTAGVHRDGGLAEFCAIPLAACEPTSVHGVEGDAAALAQPMAVAEHAVDVGELAGGERALILGAGGIGTFAVWASVSRHAEVTVYERDPDRLAIAAALGAAETVEAIEGETVLEQLREHGPFDVVYEMTGAEQPLDAAVALARPGGRVVAVGIHGARRPVDLDRVTTQEISLVGTMAHVRGGNLPRALELLAGRPAGWADIAPAVAPLEAIAGDGSFHFPSTPGGGPAIKTLVDPAAVAARPFR
jgi:(R,R)-butanediol dehydrogenase/meso-butanediol dehydrogenase/diacetyl reductase